MSKMDNPLVELRQAEERAAEIVRAEELNRVRKLQSAEAQALEHYENRRHEEVQKFQAEGAKDEGQGDSELTSLLESTQAEKQQQVALYDGAKNDVVNMLLHYVTTCDIVPEESQRQAFLALGRKAYNPDA